MLLKVFGKALGGGTRPPVHPASAPRPPRSSLQTLQTPSPRAAGGLHTPQAVLSSTPATAPVADQQEEHGRAGALGHGATLLVTWMSSNNNRCTAQVTVTNAITLNTTWCHHSLSQVSSAGVAGSRRCERYRSPDSGVNQCPRHLGSSRGTSCLQSGLENPPTSHRPSEPPGRGQKPQEPIPPLVLQGTGT